MNRGFTLVELLVVIAILGILSEVVISSVNAARGKASDSAAAQDLGGIRAQGEMVYDGNNQHYTNVCSDQNVINSMDNAARDEAVTGASAGVWGSTNTDAIACISSTDYWVAYVNLAKGPGPTTYWCVDNLGHSTMETLSPGTSATTCPQ
jgi:prepilin-type N-terminal cleavage/methylation domain-containing protein